MLKAGDLALSSHVAWGAHIIPITPISTIASLAASRSQ